MIVMLNICPTDALETNELQPMGLRQAQPRCTDRSRALSLSKRILGTTLRVARRGYTTSTKQTTNH